MDSGVEKLNGPDWIRRRASCPWYAGTGRADCVPLNIFRGNLIETGTIPRVVTSWSYPPMKKLAILVLWKVLGAEPVPAPKHVLVLMPLPVARPAPQALIRGASAMFSERMPSQVELHAEDGSAEHLAAPWLLRKFEHKPVDLILAFNYQAVAAAREFRKGRTSPPPMVSIINVADLRPEHPDEPGVVRLNLDFRPAESIRNALAVLPGTRRLAIVGGGSATDKATNKQWRERISRAWPDLELIDLTNRPLSALQESVRTLPPHTICFLANFDADPTGRAVSKLSLAEALAPHANAPLVDHIDVSFGAGTLGGWMGSVDIAGREAASVGIRVLRGEPLESAGAIGITAGSFRFDSRQLVRWNVPESRLPRGSSVEFREPTLWDRYRGWFLFALGAVAALVSLLVFLVIDRWRRERRHGEFRRNIGWDALLGQSLLAMHGRGVLRKSDFVETLLARVREQGGADQVGLLISEEEAGHQGLARWLSAPPGLPMPSLADFPFAASELQAGRAVEIADGEHGPPAEAATDRSSLTRSGFRSLFAAPVRAPGANSTVGALFVVSREARRWPPELAERMKQVGEFAISSWNQDGATSAPLGQTILSSFEGLAVAVDKHGLVLHASGSDARGCMQKPRPGAPYAAMWRGQIPAKDLMESLRAVLAGKRSEAEAELRCETGEGEQWIQVWIQPLRHSGGGALLIHLDTTRRKRAELAGVGDRERIAHWNRVAALGEMATSLAHEVNQPLSAILSNSAAARTMLEAPQPDLRAVREVLADVQNDGQRAASIVRGIRSMVRKRPMNVSETVDAADIIREALLLVAGDAARRHVEITAQAVPGARTMIAIDRTRFLQILLNLLTNALEAAESGGASGRMVVVRTSTRGSALRVEVEDNGPGVAAELRDKVFEPFFSTKDHGLGVGLSITRSIVASAGGRIWVEPAESGGARFCAEFPTVPPAVPQASG